MNKQHKALTVSCSWENIAMIAKRIMITSQNHMKNILYEYLYYTYFFNVPIVKDLKLFYLCLKSIFFLLPFILLYILEYICKFWSKVIKICIDLPIVLFIISWGVVFLTKLCQNILSVNTIIVIVWKKLYTYIPTVMK